MKDYSSPQNIRAIGERAMEGQLIGVVFDNEKKLDHFLNLLFSSYPDVKLVDRQPMSKVGPMKDVILVRVRGGTVQ